MSRSPASRGRRSRSCLTHPAYGGSLRAKGVAVMGDTRGVGAIDGTLDAEIGDPFESWSVVCASEPFRVRVDLRDEPGRPRPAGEIG